MCYSALVEQDYAEYVRSFGASVSIREFYEMYRRFYEGQNFARARAMDTAFQRGRTAADKEIAAMIAAGNVREVAELEQQLFALRKRLADAERKLQSKVTKAATEDRRIAISKSRKARADLDDRYRTTSIESDSRIYPKDYAPVMVIEDGQRVVKPMRFLCRPCGLPAEFDRTHSGAYCARRDNITKFWRRQFSETRGLMLADAFYEHVTRTLPDGSDEKTILEFRPQTRERLLVAVIWSHWRAPGQDDLLSFATITDEPPSEVAAAGHDRVIIPIKHAHVDAWLSPQTRDDATLQAILDDRPRPYYEHRLAA